jgi:hypothetical protein
MDMDMGGDITTIIRTIIMTSSSIKTQDNSGRWPFPLQKRKIILAITKKTFDIIKVVSTPTPPPKQLRIF